MEGFHYAIPLVILQAARTFPDARHTALGGLFQRLKNGCLGSKPLTSNSSKTAVQALGSMAGEATMSARC